MGKGRRPLPTAVKQLRGNPGKRKPNTGEPAGPSGDPEKPPGLSESAAKEWDDILPILRTMGVVTRADGKALAAYCYTFDIWMLANVEIKKHGVMVEEAILGRVGGAEEGLCTGYKYKKNPAVQIANEALKTMKSYLVEFGMTPASRGKLHVEKPKEVDPMDAFLARKMNDAKSSAIH
jgi:P27 family predicted phage terminase small subunit